ARFKDLPDPVMNKAVNCFSTRLPGFIYKYGSNVFVGDESLTRASFLLALYEYDKSLYTGFITHQEFNKLSSRVQELEKISTAVESNKKLQEQKLDIYTIISDIKPNLPNLLDESLKQCEVFNNLRTEVIELKKQIQTVELRQSKQSLGRAISNIPSSDKNKEIQEFNTLPLDVVVSLSMLMIFLFMPQ
ncbi:MAG: hypothetical protein QME68_04880, partial [Elusimicrobiota bacterium]|nr:hypothetical protein [Elusimicrobiota bacterium]